MSERYTLEEIEAELEVLLERDQMDMEERKVRIAALHALADIQIGKDTMGMLQLIRRTIGI